LQIPIPPLIIWYCTKAVFSVLDAEIETLKVMRPHVHAALTEPSGYSIFSGPRVLPSMVAYPLSLASDLVALAANKPLLALVAVSHWLGVCSTMLV
jgi:hypothetical protein